MSYVVEVDQSIRIDDTSRATTLAFANKKKKALIMTANLKRNCLKTLRQQGKGGDSIYISFFVAGLWLLIKENLKELDRVEIDTEFSGKVKQSQIRECLLQYMDTEDDRFRLRKSQIIFKRIGKKSMAHQLAYSVHKQKPIPGAEIIKVREKEVLSLIK